MFDRSIWEPGEIDSYRDFAGVRECTGFQALQSKVVRRLADKSVEPCRRFLALRGLTKEVFGEAKKGTLSNPLGSIISRSICRRRRSRLAPYQVSSFQTVEFRSGS
jgi:hypothetical protein